MIGDQSEGYVLQVETEMPYPADGRQHLALKTAVITFVLVQRSAPGGHDGGLRAVLVGLLEHSAHAAIAEVCVQCELLCEVNAL